MDVAAANGETAGETAGEATGEEAGDEGGSTPRAFQRFSQEFLDQLPGVTVDRMREIGPIYDAQAAYGGSFRKWLFSDSPRPYNSFGNGAAMRVSPAGFVAASEDEAKQISRAVTAVSHDHPEGIKGAEATTIAICMARNGASQEEIKQRIEADYYPLDFTIDQIRPTYRFNEICQDTVPQAIQCFLESESFEDALRIAVSLGGDTDTIAAITGSIAQAYYGIPPEIEREARQFLDDRLAGIVDDWQQFAP